MATFGKTTDGTTSSTSSANRVWVSAATPSATGTVQTGHARMWLSATAASAVNTRFAIYADSGGAPGALLAQSDVLQLATNQTSETERVFTFSGANQITVTSGTQYWIGPAWDDPDTSGSTVGMTVSRDGTASQRQEGVTTSGPTLANPFGTPTAGAGPIDAYVTFTTGNVFSKTGGAAGATAGVGAKAVAKPPFFVAAGTYLTEGNGASAAVAVPAGVAANDIVLVLLYLESTAAITPPTGFTQIGRQSATGTQDHDTVVFWKRATGADSGTYSFSWSGSVWRTGFAVAFRNCVTSGTPVDAYQGDTSGSAAVTNTPALSVTTTGADRMLVWFAGTWEVTIWTLPTGFTSIMPSGAPNSRLTVGADFVQPVAGSSGTVQGSGTNGGTVYTKTAHLLALSPVPSATTYTKAGGGASTGGGTGNRTTVHAKTGGAAAPAVGVVTKAVVHDKTGGSASPATGSGSRQLVRSKVGGATGASVAIGARGLVVQKTGGVASSAAGRGARSSIAQKTGGASSSAAAVGTRSLASATVHSKTGGGASSAAGVGGYVKEAAAGYVKSGGAASSGAATGARTTVTATFRNKTGGGAAPGTAVGARSISTASTYSKAGGAASGAAAVGGRVLSSPAVHSRTGGAASNTAGTAARVVVTAARYIKTGGAAAFCTSTGERQAVFGRTGGAQVECTGSGAVLVGSSASYVKTGGAVLVAAGAGGRSTASGGRVRLGTPEVIPGVHVMTAIPGSRHRAGTPVVVRPVIAGTPEGG